MSSPKLFAGKKGCAAGSGGVRWLFGNAAAMVEGVSRSRSVMEDWKSSGEYGASLWKGPFGGGCPFFKPLEGRSADLEVRRWEEEVPDE